MVRCGMDRLLALWQTYSEPDWLWFEPQMTYDNARYCEALLRAGIALGEEEAITVARTALDFLTENSFDRTEGFLMPVGCRGWWPRGGTKASFDQQTIEAGAYVEAYRLAASVFGEPSYTHLANRAREWFWGHNIHRLPLYDPDSGGCYDALTAEGVNLNQGAESVLSYLLAETSGVP